MAPDLVGGWVCVREREREREREMAQEFFPISWNIRIKIASCWICHLTPEFAKNW